MAQRRGVFEIGGAAAASLWAASAFAQDAGVVDAGVFDAAAPPAGARDAGELVFPAPGATGVVLNPGLIVRIPQAHLDPSRVLSDPPPLEGGLLVRDDAGGLVAVSDELALETPRPLGSPDRALDGAQVEVSTGPLALAPGRRYEVLSRMTRCELEGDTGIACLHNEYIAIGAFTTGSAIDATGPVIESIRVGPSPGMCLVTLEVTASDDHAPPSGLRYTTYQGGWLGPSLVFQTPFVNRAGRVPMSIIAIDPSGNAGAPFEVEVDGCPSLSLGNDYGSSSPEPVNPRPSTGSDGGGCALAPAATPRWIESAVLGLLAAFLLGRRQRAR
jgi:hypothetical protein